MSETVFEGSDGNGNRNGLKGRKKMKNIFFTRISQKALCALSAVLLTLSIALCSAVSFFASAKNVQRGVLRLHVIANSDSEADQAVKLLVRDRVLEAGADIFDGSVTAAEAERKISPRLDETERAAAEVLRENGFDYGVRAELVNEFFDTRAYGDITLPAGNYEAVKIVLGEGKGKNWWCVMFPPLCLPAVTRDGDGAAVFSEDERRVVEQSPKYEVRFKLAELFERIFKRD